MQQATPLFADRGSNLLDAEARAAAWIANEVQVQASYLAYMDVFHVLMIISAMMVPLALILRRIDLSHGSAPGGH